MRDKKELTQEFVAVSERPDFPQSNFLPFLEALIDIRDTLVKINENQKIIADHLKSWNDDGQLSIRQR